MDDRRRDGGTNSTLRTKEQGAHLTFNEHDDDDEKNMVVPDMPQMTNMVHVHFMPDTLGYKHIIRVCNIYCFSAATLFARTRLMLRLYIYTRVGNFIVATIYLQLIQNRYMFRSFTVLQCSHQHCVQPVASDVEVVGYI